MGAETPDYTLASNDKEPPQITLRFRKEPWRIRLEGHDLLVVVECEMEDDPVVGPEDYAATTRV